jgi:hypothetical protein
VAAASGYLASVIVDGRHQGAIAADRWNSLSDGGLNPRSHRKEGQLRMRKVIEFDDQTYQTLVQLGRDRMATLQELADESFADLLKKHGVPKDLTDALSRSVTAAKRSGKTTSRAKRR